MCAFIGEKKRMKMLFKQKLRRPVKSKRVLTSCRQNRINRAFRFASTPCSVWRFLCNLYVWMQKMLSWFLFDRFDKKSQTWQNNWVFIHMLQHRDSTAITEVLENKEIDDCSLTVLLTSLAFYVAKRPLYQNGFFFLLPA